MKQILKWMLIILIAASCLLMAWIFGNMFLYYYGDSSYAYVIEKPWLGVIDCILVIAVLRVTLKVGYKI